MTSRYPCFECCRCALETSPSDTASECRDVPGSETCHCCVLVR